jgi:choloylglycine hydrolase
MCTNLLLNLPGESPDTPLRVSSRTLELSGHMPSRFFLVPQNQSFPLPTVPGLKRPFDNPFQWVSKYGFVGVSDPNLLKVPGPAEFGVIPAFMDGMNEKGLSAASLWLPGTRYPSGGSKPQMAYWDIVSWILGTCATADEVVQAIGNISFWGPEVHGEPSLYLPLHFIATDPTGRSVVIEFVNGETVVYGPDWNDGATADGVLTNAPTYDWHRTNLEFYCNLSVVGPETSVTMTTPPVGNGLMGLPGDQMSTSRFVRAAIFANGFRNLPPNGEGWIPAPLGKGDSGARQTAINISMQLATMVMETPYGTVLTKKDPTSSDAPTVGDWTMWAVVRDHTNRAIYYTTAFNGIMRCIDLAKLDFADGKPYPHFASIPFLPAPGDEAWYLDATNQFGQ